MLELFQRGGFAAYPLAVCSVLAVGIMLERLYTLGRLKRAEAKAFQYLKGVFASGHEPNLGNREIVGAPITEVLHAVGRIGNEEGSSQSAVEIALAGQRLRLRRYLSTLATIGSTAPFIGLFGTVLGVMRAFQEMSRSSLSGEAMAAGISEALSATALGLMVAIPSVIAYNFLLNKVQAMLLDIQFHAAELVEDTANAQRVEQAA
jgi:biopolymer transport protein ExbB/TolQ